MKEFQKLFGAGYWVIILKNKKPKQVLCYGDKITGSSFKPPFYRGKIRKQICRFNSSRGAKAAARLIKGTDVCGASTKTEVVSYPSLWH